VDETLQHAQRINRQYQLPINIQDECNRTVVRKWIDEGNMAAVAEWIKRREFSIESPEIRGLENEYFLVARYAAAQNNLTAAAALLERISTSAQTPGKTAIVIAIQAYHALVLQQMGDSRGAFALLTNALEAAEAQGFIRTFVDEGKPMQRLLAALQPRLTPKLQSYVGTLLQAFGQPAQETPQISTPPHAADPSYVERLSARELEVLRLVDQGLSDKEIAAELILATGTVKRHLNNIYGKLDVRNRTHALARARTLKLL
jgi:LuxR family maltose regulon positive regulatory protein